MTTVGLITFLAMTSSSVGTVVSGYPVAGVAPHERPAGAPTVTVQLKDGQWYQRALKGVQKPYSNSLRFLEDQGSWYTPFNGPGMTGRYDIRGWHRK